jgi:hypothetical protein
MLLSQGKSRLRVEGSKLMRRIIGDFFRQFVNPRSRDSINAKQGWLRPFESFARDLVHRLAAAFHADGDLASSAVEVHGLSRKTR